MNNEMNKRLGFVGIIITRRETASRAVNDVLSRFGELILARVGLPCRHRRESVITLVVEATTDELGALTGALGQIPDVTLKSALAPLPKE